MTVCVALPEEETPCIRGTDAIDLGNGMNELKTIEVYINLPEEETPCIRPTDAIDLGNGTYKLLPTLGYDPEDEVWEFLPGSIVKCEISNNYRTKNILLAVEQIK